jgi:uncharacterized membrane protein (UPF0127 family)
MERSINGSNGNTDFLLTKIICSTPRFPPTFSDMSLHLTHRLLPLTLLVCALPAFALTPPQATLPTIRLSIGSTTVKAEVADEPGERSSGLMGRKELADGEGMLFVFAEPQPLSFWMHDTLVPLSIAYINAQGVIREIHDMKPLDENTAQSMFRDLLYALEVPQGWFERNNILPGDRIAGLPAASTAKPD